MIKVNNINGSPESIPDEFIGIHSDDEFFYFFETINERDNYLNSLPQQEIKEEIGTALQSVLNATPEEIEKIKQILNIK